MSTSLLAAKHHIPPLRVEAVNRPQLLDVMNDGLRRKLTLVAAPAGYGKTTLLSQWAHQVHARVAWLSVDKNDNDLPRFLAYFFSALHAADSEIDPVMLPMGPAPQLPPVEVVLTPLLNELAALDRPLVVVLDDYHLIESQPVHSSITFLLEHLPPQMHMVIGTRADPNLTIARLRAKGELVEVREVDLRFSSEESSFYLNHVMGLTLSKDQINKLASRTEGWIAGLQLAAISMQGKDDLVAFIDAFSGSHEYIVDYLTDEVLNGQPEDLQTFLLQTSILDRLSGSLCEAVTGQEGGEATLEQLRETHLFLIPLDDQRRWYRYHRLFADHLLKRLRHLQPGTVDTLHHRASEWYEQNGWMAEAIDHALAARDYDRSAALIERITEETMMKSEFTLFLRWVDALPEPVVQAYPELGIAQSMALLMQGSSADMVELRLNRLLCDTDALLGAKNVVLATSAVVQGQLSEAYDLSQNAVKLLAGEKNSLRDIANWIISYTSALESTPSEGIRNLENIVQESQSSGNLMLTVAASYEIAKLYTFKGQLQSARHTFEQVMGLTIDKGGKLLPIAGEGLIGLGELSREENQLVESEQSLLKGIELSRLGRTATSYRGYLSLAKLRLAQGDVAGAYDHFREAKQRAAFKFDQLLVDVAETTARLSQGELEVAERWLIERGWKGELSFPEEDGNAINKHIRKYEHLLQVRVLLAHNQPREALTSLETLQGLMEQQERLDMILEIQILKALAFQAQDNSEEALTELESALALAKSGGYVRILVDEGEPMRRLLLEAIAQGIEPEYCAQLLTAFQVHGFEEIGPSRSLHTDLVEPLSARELQVLRLLASHLTSTEIAEELFLSVNTVRFHIKNIYSKLDVHRRAEAVERAKGLGLI